MADRLRATTTLDAKASVGQMVLDNSTTASITSQTSSQVALASNVNRQFLSLYNYSDQYAYVKWGPNASLSDFSLAMEPRGYYESVLPIFRGTVSVIWASANGSLKVTEAT